MYFNIINKIKINLVNFTCLVSLYMIEESELYNNMLRYLVLDVIHSKIYGPLVKIG